MGIITSFIGFFAGKYAKLAWSLVGILLVVGAITTGVVMFENMLRRDAQLKSQNNELTQAVADRDGLITKMDADQQEFLTRANEVMVEMGDLQQKMAQNSAQRQKDYNNIVTKPGVGVTSDQIEKKANAGMNGLFHDLSSQSREGIDDKSK